MYLRIRFHISLGIIFPHLGLLKPFCGLDLNFPNSTYSVFNMHPKEEGRSVGEEFGGEGNSVHLPLSLSIPTSLSPLPFPFLFSLFPFPSLSIPFPIYSLSQQTLGLNSEPDSAEPEPESAELESLEFPRTTKKPGKVCKSLKRLSWEKRRERGKQVKAKARVKANPN